MKWIKIKTEDDLPKSGDGIFVRWLLNGKYHKEVVSLRVLNHLWKDHALVEWLDESINQDVSDIDVGNIGSLKDSDWKEKIEMVCLKNDIDPEIEDELINALAPLLQNELKGDDLVARLRSDEYMKKAAKDLCWQCWSMWSGFNLDTPIEEFEKRDKHFEAWWMGKSLELNMPNRITEPHNGASQEKPNSSTDDGQQNPSQLKEATILSALQILKKHHDFDEGVTNYEKNCVLAAMEEFHNQFK